jgi:hypothetical protein
MPSAYIFCRRRSHICAGDIRIVPYARLIKLQYTRRLRKVGCAEKKNAPRHLRCHCDIFFCLRFLLGDIKSFLRQDEMMFCRRECSGKLKIGDLDSRRGHIFNATVKENVCGANAVTAEKTQLMAQRRPAGSIAFALNCTALLKRLMMRQRWKTLLRSNWHERLPFIYWSMCLTSNAGHWRFI